jgi:hypothetical protein
MLIAKDYLGYPLVVRESLLNDFGKYFGVMRSGDIYQMLVHAALLGKRFYRISEFLACTANVESTSNLGRRIRALEQEHKHAGHRFSFNTGLTSDTICQKKVFDSHPSVTIIVPTQRSCGQTRFGNRPHILNLLDSLATLTWPADKLEVIVGDDKGIESIYDEHNWSFKLTLLDTQRKHQAFNYAKKMNMLWRASQTENVIFMNDDLIVNSIDFIESLLTFSTETDVGGVGACLSFPDGNYQHVGMIGGIFGAFAHPWYKASPKKKHYGDWPLINREYSAVTGAVFATRRAVLEEINGFDEFFSLDFNDVDMCLRMRLLGYRIIYTPFASLVHLEGASRSGATAPGNQILTFLNKWRDVIDDDPMYNPSLSRNSDEVFCHLDD